MIQDVKKFIEPYVALDEPIPYKDFRIKPILMKDSSEFLNACDVLDLDAEKNKIPDVNIIQMTYLEYISTQLMFDNTSIDNNMTKGDIWKYKFFIVLSLCLDIEPKDLSIIKEHGFKLSIKGTIINATEFDTLRKIIMYQNIVDYDDTPISDDYKKMIEKYYTLKNADIVAPTLEDKVDVVLSNTAYDITTLQTMTYRRFQRLFDKIIDKTEYIVGAIFKSQGSKEPLEHWVYKKKKDKYSGVFTKMDALK